MTPKTIKELAPKPSDAIKAMLVGIKRHKALGLAYIELHSFGDIIYDSGFMPDGSEPRCIGCAAVAAIFQLAKKKATTSNIDVESHYRLFNEDSDNVYAFEQALNHARMAELKRLLQFYGESGYLEDLTQEQQKVISEWQDDRRARFVINDIGENKVEALPIIAMYNDRLREAGL